MLLNVISKPWRYILYMAPLAWAIAKNVDILRQRLCKLFQSKSKTSESNRDNINGIRGFSEIPGPWPALPIIGTQWLYVWPGPYRLSKLHLANEDKFYKYGPIVKEHYLWNFPIIHLYDKKDIETVLRYPSKFPIRPELEAQGSYRRSRPERYNSVGLVNAQGHEWFILRSKLTPALSSPNIIQHAVDQTALVADDLVGKLKRERNRNNGIVNQFDKYVYRFSLEAIVAIILNQRLGSLNDEVTPITEKLMLATDKLFEVCHATMYGLPLWKYLPSKSYAELIECEDIIYETFASFVNEAMDRLDRGESDGVPCVLDQILAAKDIDKRDKIAAVIDLVSGGIDSTGNAIIFLLYNILSNAEVRKLAYEEVDRILPGKSQLTVDSLKELTYLKACVLESLRLSPVAPNVARILEKDFVLQGYFVPAGTLVVCETWAASLQEDNYEKARLFVPQRWMAAEKNTNPFLALPFGVGRRMCPGRRVAEHEMIIMTAKLLQNFDIEFHEPVESIYKFLISPRRPFDVSVVDRTWTI